MIIPSVYAIIYVLSAANFRAVDASLLATTQKWLTRSWNSDNLKFISNKRTHLTIHPAHPSTRKLSSGVGSKEIKPAELPSLLMETITLQLDEEDDDTVMIFNGVHVKGDSWYGKEQGGRGSIHLVRPKGSRLMEGIAITSKGEVLTISTQPKDGSIFVYHQSSSDSPIAQLYLGIRHEHVKDHTSNRQRILHDTPKKNDIIEVDMMILYTKRAMCAHAYVEYDQCETKGREGQKNREAIEAEAMLNYLITNVALQHSNSKVRFNLVHVGLDEFEYADASTNYETEGDLTEILDNFLIEKNEKVHRLRNHTGADVVALIVDKNYVDLFGTNGKSGDVFYDAKQECVPGEVSDDGYDTSTDTCPGRAYIVLSRNGRHHFLFTHEISHLFLGYGHNNVCNKKSNVAPYYAPCFETVTSGRGECGACYDPQNHVIVDDTYGSNLVPRIPLFTGPNGVEYSGFPLDEVSSCPRTSNLLTDAECVDFSGPLVASFRKKKAGPRHDVKLTFAFAFVTMCAIAGLIVKKRRQVYVKQDVQAEVYVAERQYDMVSLDKKAQLAGVEWLAYMPPASPLSVHLVGESKS